MLRRAIIKRRLDQKMKQDFLELRKKRYYKLREKDGQTGASLVDLPSGIKENIREKLMEQRVIQHVPADMGGALLKETIQRVLSVDGSGEDAMVSLSKKKDGKKEKIR